jgi:hypothetical protein
MQQPFAFDFRNNRCHKKKKCSIPSLTLAGTAIPILPPAALLCSLLTHGMKKGSFG